jgi:cytochrome P450
MANNRENDLISPPIPDSQAGLQALKAMISWRGFRPTIDPLAALQAFHESAGDIYQLNVGRFQPIIMAGPEAGRFIYVTNRRHFSWRNEQDAVVKLLRRGVLIVDSQEHDHLRRLMQPALHKGKLIEYAPTILSYTDQVTNAWHNGQVVDMLVEMRRIALLNLVSTLFGVDLTPDLERIWHPILKAIQYISPGLWLLWSDVPRPFYSKPLTELDAWLYEVIQERRKIGLEDADDMLAGLIAQPDLNDDLIRDQMLTMLIAGHDTATALMAWSLYLLGSHPDELSTLYAEIDQLESKEIGLEHLPALTHLDCVISEALRLYPPIHASIRRAIDDVDFQGFQIPAGSRILYSIYLTNRHPDHWKQPDEFLPDRFLQKRPNTYTYVPFGGGPRNCIGAYFGKIEAKLVLARLLSRFELELTEQHIHPHMGATLEPRPGVRMRIYRRI